jgi:hypothetical protein
MKLCTLLVFTALAVGCGKPSDLGPLQEEALGLASTSKLRVDAAEARLNGIVERSKKIPAGAVAGLPDLQAVEQLFNSTRSRIDEMRNVATGAPAKIKEAARELTADEQAQRVASKAERKNPRAEVVRETHQMQKRLNDGLLEINRNLDTLESWMVYIDVRPKVAAAPPPPPPPPAPTGTEPPPDPTRPVESPTPPPPPAPAPAAPTRAPAPAPAPAAGSAR